MLILRCVIEQQLGKNYLCSVLKIPLKEGTKNNNNNNNNIKHYSNYSMTAKLSDIP